MLRWMPFWMHFVIFAEVFVNDFGIKFGKFRNMEVVTAREFRSNQGKFLTAAREGKSVMLTSRYGNFKIVPISSADEIVERDIRTAYTEAMAHAKGDMQLPMAKDVVF